VFCCGLFPCPCHDDFSLSAVEKISGNPNESFFSLFDCVLVLLGLWALLLFVRDYQQEGNSSIPMRLP
jgi:hypothetical protein